MTILETALQAARELDAALTLSSPRTTTRVRRRSSSSRIKAKAPRGNKNYLSGRGFEYRCKRLLERAGYHVHRSYASKGCYDLVAIKRYPVLSYPRWRALSKVLFIQCKKGKRAKLKDYEVKQLCALAAFTGGYPIQAICKVPRGPVWWNDLRDERYTPFNP